MVYVSIDDISFDEGEFFVDMNVMGFKPSGCIEAVDFLTNVFERMEYDYLRAELTLRRLGYYIAELSRRKIYLGVVVPENTYFWTPDWRPPDCSVKNEKCGEDRPICVFVDVGSPLRRVYIAYPAFEWAFEWGGWAEITYWVEGVGVYHTGREKLIIKADFHSGTPVCTARWCDDYLKAIEDKIDSKELYIGVYPAPVDEKHRMKLSLVEKALKLAGLT